MKNQLIPICSEESTSSVLKMTGGASWRALVLGLSLCLHHTVWAALMDYHDVTELETALVNLATQSRHAQLFRIGYSTDYHTNPRQPRHYPIYALRVSESTNEWIHDDPRKNSILFEAGTHPREWLGTESCLMLAEYLVEHAEDDHSHVPRLLRGSDVWIVPLTTVAGRALDDTDGGDPRHYSTSPSDAGWRGNGDTRECEYGVNVARNFSRGWSSASPELGANYRGFAPFSTEEAAALRNFVQNHGISMAVVIHSNSQKIWNQWGDDDVAGRWMSEFGQWFWRSDLDDSDLALTRTGVGGGVGQFSAWLTRSSDQAGEPDFHTVRGIQTMFIELPFLAENYHGDYRHSVHDGSNGFHPSGDHVRDLIRNSFIPMATSFILFSQSPGALTYMGVPFCPEHDFGLVAAKIAADTYGSGSLETYCATENQGVITPARDYLALGSYNLPYRVQNFSAHEHSNAVDVRLTVTRSADRAGNPDVVVSTETHSYSGLVLMEARQSHFSLNADHANSDYTVTLEARPARGFTNGTHDDFSFNDKKVFKFRTYELL